jgi:hypothetical protein
MKPDSLARRLGMLLVLPWALAAPVSALTLTAVDAGFVTEAGGSAKGDGTVASGAKYNYSAGFELHYATGALGAPLAPMFRKNYFVFDLSGVGGALASAKITLWSGTLETADASESWLMMNTIDMPAAVGLAAALAGGALPGEFDETTDPLVISASMLYGKLADGPMVLGGFVITHAMDDSFIDIVFSPAGLGHLSSFVGGKVVLAGMVPSAMPPGFPQQPFGFTGPDIPGGDPKTPTLTVTVVPEPDPAWMLLLGLLTGLALRAGIRRR